MKILNDKDRGYVITFIFCYDGFNHSLQDYITRTGTIFCLHGVGKN